MRSGTPARARTSAVEKLVGRTTARSKPASAHLVREPRASRAARVAPGGVVDENVVDLFREAVQLRDPRAREDGEPPRRVGGLERAERGAGHDDVADPVRRPHERLHARLSQRRRGARPRPVRPSSRSSARPRRRVRPRRGAPGVPRRGGRRARPPPTRRDRASARGRPRAPSATISRDPPTSCPTTGHPAAIASTRTSGPPSLAEGRSMRWLAAKRAPASSTWPANVQRSATPRAAASASTPARAGPPPRKSACASIPSAASRASVSTTTSWPLCPSNAPAWTSRNGGGGGATFSRNASAGSPSGTTAIFSAGTPAVCEGRRDGARDGEVTGGRAVLEPRERAPAGRERRRGGGRRAARSPPRGRRPPRHGRARRRRRRSRGGRSAPRGRPRGGGRGRPRSREEPRPCRGRSARASRRKGAPAAREQADGVAARSEAGQEERGLALSPAHPGAEIQREQPHGGRG